VIENLTLVIRMEGNQGPFIGHLHRASYSFNKEMSEALLLKSRTRRECPVK
jgi:hypothetical protein